MTDEQPKEIVLIEWVDAESDVGWETPSPDDADELPICESIGWIIKEEATFLIIAADHDDTNGHYNRRIKIPLGMVKNVYPLKKAKAPKKRGKRKA